MVTPAFIGPDPRRSPNMGVGREGQDARQQQHQERAGEKADAGGEPHAQILRAPVIGALGVGGEILRLALEVAAFPLELERGGPHQALAAALERAGVMLRTVAQDGRLFDGL